MHNLYSVVLLTFQLMNLHWPDLATVARYLYLPVLFLEGQRGREATVK